ncbi:MAG TPA: hypothetical protein VFY61_07190, partial [Pyrinomonadaceae bacterium]|nr:hypothetical protein [Pyrinomonadaceae bacterium]
MRGTKLTALVLIVYSAAVFSFADQEKPARSPSIFREVAEQTGLKFQHYNGMTGKFYLPEITGSGAAL